MKIMLGYHDFTLDSRILKTAVLHAKTFKAQLFLVTCIKIGEDVPKSEFDKAEKGLQQGEKFFQDKGINCTARLLETALEPGEALVNFASNHQMDELLIGVRNRSKLGKLIFGSTAQYVILNSPCPVLSTMDED